MTLEIALTLIGIVSLGGTAVLSFMLARSRSALARVAAEADEALVAAQEELKRITFPVLPDECGSCDHFDLQAGQDALAHHPAFLQAANHLSPHAMARGVEHDDAGGVIPPVSRGEAKWDQMGACHALEEGVFMHMPPCKEGHFVRADEDELKRRQESQREATKNG